LIYSNFKTILSRQNMTKKEKVDELIIANEELAYQNEEKENNAMTHDLE